MPWAPRGDADPALTTRSWRKIRKYWQAQGLPCSICHRMIDYGGPRFYLVGGKRRMNPRYLCVGHITSRHEARQRGWSEAEVNCIENTRPECQRCSNSSGARLGRQIQDGMPARARKPAARW